jgi:hypothetical protein
MRAKSIATIVLLAFVGVSVAYLIVKELRSKPAASTGPKPVGVAGAESGTPADAEPTSSTPDPQTGHKLIAYYFHRTQRCTKCLTIEAYAEEALMEAFPEALETGELEWRAVNVEEPANEHFVGEYQVISSALVLVDTYDGERKDWRNLEQVWELVGDELEFKAYVESEAMVFLELDS